MKDWFMQIIMNLPTAEDDGIEILHINKGQSKQVFMDQARVVGIGHKTIATKEFLENAEQLTWDEFRRKNIVNAITGKTFYQPKYIAKVAKILRLLDWQKGDVTVYLPLKGVAMFTIDSDTDMALFLAPCIARDVSCFHKENKESEK